MYPCITSEFVQSNRLKKSSPPRELPPSTAALEPTCIEALIRRGLSESAAVSILGGSSQKVAFWKGIPLISRKYSTLFLRVSPFDFLVAKCCKWPLFRHCILGKLSFFAPRKQIVLLKSFVQTHICFQGIFVLMC